MLRQNAIITLPKDPDTADRLILGLNLLFIAYFVMIQCLHIYHDRLNHFKSFWNIIDLFSLAANLIFICFDILQYPPEIVRTTGAVCVFFMFVKIFFFLRLFTSTSNMIRLIIEVCIDMGGFSFILLIALLAWAVCYYILNINAYEMAE